MTRVITRNSQLLPLPRRLRNKCRRVWSALRLARRKARYRRRDEPVETTRAAFIVGCQRSGTTMALFMLNESLDVDVLNESDARAFVECRIKDIETRRRLLDRSTASCLIFKPVCESHRLNDLLCEHPGSRGIWMYRDYADVANSAVTLWGDTTKRYMLDLFKGGGDWGGYQWNRERINDECLDELRAAAPDDPAPHEAAALFWYMRNRTLFEQPLLHRPDVLIMRYEPLVGDADEGFRRLCAFLDVGFSPRMVRRVSKASVGRKNRPPLCDSVEDLCRGMLERLDAACADQDRE